MCSDRSFVLDIHTGFNWIIAVSEHLEAVWSIRQMAGNEIRFCCSAWKGFSKILCGKTEQKDSTNCLCIFHLRSAKIIMEQRNPKYLILSCSPTHWCLWQIFNIGSQLEKYYRKKFHNIHRDSDVHDILNRPLLMRSNSDARVTRTKRSSFKSFDNKICSINPLWAKEEDTDRLNSE